MSNGNKRRRRKNPLTGLGPRLPESPEATGSELPIKTKGQIEAEGRELERGREKGREILRIVEQRRQALSPKLATTPGPRRRRRRSGDPFNFFGTLFTTPRTLSLNPLADF